MTSIDHHSERTGRSGRNFPRYLWILVGVGAVAGALLAEPGDVVGNTLPSTVTFAVAGLVLGLLVWAAQTMLTRRESNTR